MKVKLLKKIRKKFLIKHAKDVEKSDHKMLYIYNKKTHTIVSNRWWGYDQLPDLAFILTHLGDRKLLTKYWNKKALIRFNKL